MKYRKGSRKLCEAAKLHEATRFSMVNRSVKFGQPFCYSRSGALATFAFVSPDESIACILQLGGFAVSSENRKHRLGFRYLVKESLWISL